MLILGIESSCDETAASVIRDGTEVLSSKIASQIAVHAVFGGVVPEIASRQHLEVIDDVVRSALSDAGVTMDQIDAIAITRGPGLIGALLVGISYAKGLAIASNKPLIPVDHVHAHIHGGLLSTSLNSDRLFPCLALVVSGGHTNLYRMNDWTHFKLIGNSIDDACGECFDKVAKMLDLPYPGGPKIESLALKGNEDKYQMPLMVAEKGRLVFSYSGLKTHMVNLINSKRKELSPEMISDLAASFQKAALDQIVRKLNEAIELEGGIFRSLLVAGGVAASSAFRRMVAEKIRIPAVFPDLKYCSDNAAMIAAYGYHTLIAAGSDRSRFFDHAWDAYSRYDFSSARL
jgi:N6-L-threonylcarbamoyladenine synthase